MGDAALAMTMNRGEAVNHGILDVESLLREVLPALNISHVVHVRHIREVCERYTRDMVKRAAPDVHERRQACLDAHSYGRINDDRPLIQKGLQQTTSLRGAGCDCITKATKSTFCLPMTDSSYHI